jgi:hypothetical protein
VRTGADAVAAAGVPEVVVAHIQQLGDDLRHGRPLRRLVVPTRLCSRAGTSATGIVEHAAHYQRHTVKITVSSESTRKIRSNRMNLYEPRHAVLCIRGHGRPFLCEHQRLYLLRECLGPGRLQSKHRRSVHKTRAGQNYLLARLLCDAAQTCETCTRELGKAFQSEEGSPHCRKRSRTAACRRRTRPSGR